MNTCQNCRFWRNPEQQEFGACRRFPAVIETKADDWCGEYRDTHSQFNAAPEKLTDDDILEFMRRQPTHEMLWRDGLDALSVSFQASRRTVEERVKRLEWLQKLVIVKSPTGRRELVLLHPSVDGDWASWVELCQRTNGDPNVRWKTMEESGEIPVGGTKPVRGNAKWSFAEHVLPTFKAQAFDAEHAARYSRLAEIAFQSCKINRSSFNKIVMHEVKIGGIIRTDQGLYHLAQI